MTLSDIFFLNDQDFMNVSGILSSSFFNKIFIYHSLDNKNDAPKALGINPYFLNDYKKAAVIYPMKRVSKIFNYLLEADKKSKGINYDGTDNEGILKELIYKILKSN